MPASDPIKFSSGQDSKMDDSDEIARSFIHSISKSCKKIILKDETLELDLRCSGHICSGELNIESSGKSTLIIRLSGDAGWTGLRIHGAVEGNFPWLQ